MPPKRELQLGHLSPAAREALEALPKSAQLRDRVAEILEHSGPIEDLLKPKPSKPHYQVVTIGVWSNEREMHPGEDLLNLFAGGGYELVTVTRSEEQLDPHFTMVWWTFFLRCTEP